MNKEKILDTSLKIVGGSILVLSALNLIGSNVLATRGHELNNVFAEITKLDKENNYLKNQIAHNTSLYELENWASANGYVSIDSPIAIATPAPVALAN